jgi:hypothetical protein
MCPNDRGVEAATGSKSWKGRCEVTSREQWCEAVRDRTRSGDREVVALNMMDALDAEIERLQAIVDKMPKTVDGEPLLPGMTVFCLSSWGQISSCSITNWHEIAWMVTTPHLWYSIPEAAEKERKEA